MKEFNFEGAKKEKERREVETEFDILKKEADSTLRERENTNQVIELIKTAGESGLVEHLVEAQEILDADTLWTIRPSMNLNRGITSRFSYRPPLLVNKEELTEAVFQNWGHRLQRFPRRDWETYKNGEAIVGNFPVPPRLEFENLINEYPYPFETFRSSITRSVLPQLSRIEKEVYKDIYDLGDEISFLFFLQNTKTWVTDSRHLDLILVADVRNDGIHIMHGKGVSQYQGWPTQRYEPPLENDVTSLTKFNASEETYNETRQLIENAISRPLEITKNPYSLGWEELLLRGKLEAKE